MVHGIKSPKSSLKPPHHAFAPPLHISCCYANLSRVAILRCRASRPPNINGVIQMKFPRYVRLFMQSFAFFGAAAYTFAMAAEPGQNEVQATPPSDTFAANPQLSVPGSQTPPIKANVPLLWDRLDPRSLERKINTRSSGVARPVFPAELP